MVAKKLVAYGNGGYCSIEQYKQITVITPDQRTVRLSCFPYGWDLL